MKNTLFLDRALVFKFVFEVSKKFELEERIYEVTKGYDCISFETGSMSALRNKLNEISAFSGKLLPLSIEEDLITTIEDEINLKNTIEYLSNQTDILHAFENYKSYTKGYEGKIMDSLGYIYRLLLISAKFNSDILIWEPRFKILQTILKQAKISFKTDAINSSVFRISFSKSESIKLALKPIDSLVKKTTLVYLKEVTDQNKNIPVIVILAAIKEEYLAVRSHLTNLQEVNLDGTQYEKGLFIFDKVIIASVVIRECGPKNNIASQETERAIQYFQPKCMFFVGIAGSRKPMDFEIGDVIFAEKIYSYEAGKSSENSFFARPDLESTSFVLLEKAKQIRLKNEWQCLIKGTYNRNVKADTGIVASGEKLVEHYNSTIGSILKEHYNDTAVVEMEGFGFAKAAKRQGGANKNLLIGVIRGISDILINDNLPGDSTNLDRRPQNAKIFASDTAAAFTYWLILKTFEYSK